MSPELTFLALAAAFILFAIASTVAIISRRTYEALLAAGLALWVLVPMWKALTGL